MIDLQSCFDSILMVMRIGVIDEINNAIMLLDDEEIIIDNFGYHQPLEIDDPMSLHITKTNVWLDSEDVSLKSFCTDDLLFILEQINNKIDEQ